MSNSITKFIDLLSSQVDRGIYVWGGNGENLSEMDKPREWIARHEADAKDEKRAIALFDQRVADGVTDIRAFDCSGLVYWALKTMGLQKTDLSSRGLYAACDKIEKAELRPGDLVFHSDGKRIVHVGVYIGTNRYIEAKGRDVGVVCGERKPMYWTHFGRWKAFENEPKPEPTDDLVLVKGRSVYVRNGDSTLASVIGVAHRKETYRMIAVAPSGWYEIDFKGQIGFISNRPDLTEVVTHA
jgi:cell wall-associated NlpC family hydrolase